MSNTPATWLDSQTVNATTTGNQSQSSITQLANGNILVTWSTDDPGGDGFPDGTEVFAQIFDPLGTRIGTEFRINQQSISDNERDSDVVALPNGGFIVIYHDDDLSNNGGSNIRLAEFDATGAGVSENSLVVNDGLTPALPNFANPRGAASSDTSVMIVYDKIDAASTGVFCKVYDPTTNSYGAEIPLVIGGTIREADITVLTNGNYVIAVGKETSGSAIFYRIMNTSGVNVLGSTGVIGTVGDGDTEVDASVTALTGGGFVIAYTNTDTVSNDTGLLYHVYSAAGVQTASGALTSASQNKNINEPAVTGLADGSFIIAYDNDDTNVGVAAHISAAGLVLGEFSFTGSVAELDITDLADGRVAVSYTNNGDIQMEILDTRDAPNNPGVYLPDQWVVGTVGDDVFTPAANAEITHGGDGNDTITETGGSRQYFGDTGNDTIIVISVINFDLHDGGVGINDTINWSAADEVGATFDLALGTATDTGLNGEQMLNFENLIGTVNRDIIIGTSGVNDLKGGGGNDEIKGGAGADHIDGGAGTGDIADYRTSTGSSVNISLLADTASGGEAAGDTLDNIENLFGSLTLRDILIGDNGNNVLKGFGGADSLRGEGGDDYLDGGAGGDALNAGAGANDWAGYRDSTVGTVSINLLTAVLSGGDAQGDTLFFIENLEGSLTNRDILIGNVLVNTLVGNGGADSIRGEDGNDIIEGGDGGDGLNAGAGIDTVVYERSSAGVTVNLNVALQTSFGEASGDSLFFFENITGSAFDDSLSGNLFSNRLVGGAGADTLNGALGSDFLTGGTGADTFRFQDMSFGSDTILDWQDGVDHISVALPLETSFAGLTFTGNGTSQVVVRGFNGTGSALIVKADDGFVLDVSDFVFV